MRKIVTLGFICFSPLLFAACSKEPERHVKTPQELLDDELAKGDNNKPDSSSEYVSNADLQEAALDDEDRFDEENVEYELKRTSIGASSCPDAFDEEQLKGFKPGTAQLKILFANDGRVKQVEIDEVYKDTTVGDCVERAFSSVHIRSYVGKEESVDWQLELKVSPPEEKK